MEQDEMRGKASPSDYKDSGDSTKKKDHDGFFLSPFTTVASWKTFFRPTDTNEQGKPKRQRRGEELSWYRSYYFAYFP